MLGSVVLEVMIGLALVYLLLSLVCSTIQEAVAAWLNWRGAMLRTAIGRLLSESKELVDAVYGHALIATLSGGERNPSYIPNRTFAETLLALLAPTPDARARSAQERLSALERSLESGKAGSMDLPEPLRQSLTTLLENARDKLSTQQANAAQVLEQLKQEIDAWFERTMNRATGWYRRKSQLSQFIIAALVVVLTNADTLMVTEQLASDPEARAAAVQSAVELVKSPPAALAPTAGGAPAMSQNERQAWLKARESAEQAVGQLYETTSRAQLQFGWPDTRWRDSTSSEAQLADWQRWARKVIGLLVTICAVALGAPFWFQMLEKLVGLRGAGARSDKSAAAREPASGDKKTGSASGG